MAVKHTLVCDVSGAEIHEGLTFFTSADKLYVELIRIEDGCGLRPDTPVAAGFDALVRHPAFRTSVEAIRTQQARPPSPNSDQGVACSARQQSTS